MTKKYITALTIAGSDSSGGAGIQADLKTFSALGVYGASVITVLTAQNTQGVYSIMPVTPNFVGEQIDAVFTDLEINAVKVGMLFSSAIIKEVVLKLKKYNPKNLILDPVMFAKSGDKLLEDSAIEILINELLPLAKIITPNLKEAELILGREITNYNEFEKANEEIISKNNIEAVFLKAGGFQDNNSNDLLSIKENNIINHLWLESKRIDTLNTHGTGCSISSAITANIAKGFSLFDSVKKSKEYINKAIISGAEYKLGKGKGPIDHFFNLRN